MRLRIDVTTRAAAIPWNDVLRPGRSLVYGLFARTAPELGTRLHTDGWGPHRMVPFGYGAPRFPGARRRPGEYAAGGRGYLELGSPLPGVVDTWVEALAEQPILDWGGTALHIERLVPSAPPMFDSGTAELRTVTPVVLKPSKPAHEDRDRNDRSRASQDLLPYEEGFRETFGRNLRRKAETLELDPEITVEGVTWIGAKRSFTVRSGKRVGTPLGVRLRGAPATLRALWCWGLGQANAAGFGWIDTPAPPRAGGRPPRAKRS